MNRIVPMSALLLAALAAETAAQNWTFLNPPPYPTLLSRRAGGCAYDLIQGKVLIYGGLQSGPTLALDDTWAFDGAAWTQLTPATTPPPRWGHRMVYDSRRARIVTFGGRSPTITTTANDTWEWDGFDWIQMSPTNSPNPRAFYSMAFDERRGVTVLYGTMSGSTVGTSGGDQTWEYDGTTWTQAVTAFTPPGLESPGMTYDKGRGVIVMFGGFNGQTGTDYQKTWEYDGNDWVERVTANAPLSGYATACVYDEARGRVVLYGGYSAGAIQQNVWEYDGNDWTLVLGGTGPGKIVEGYAAYSPTLAGTVYFSGTGPPVGGTVNNETWLYTGATTAIAAAFGNGCATSAGIPTLTPTTLPVIGTSYDQTMSGGPASAVGVLVLGLGNLFFAAGSYLPLDLTPIGIAGCGLEVTPDVLVTQLVSGGSFTQVIAIPNNAALTGFTLYSQAFVLDPQSPNGFGGLSNAIHAVVGL